MRKMKDSGIVWAIKIPENWDVMPNKFLMRKEKTIVCKYNGENILSLTMNGVIVRNFESGGKMPLSFDGYQRIKAGNLLLCLFDIDVTPRCVGIIKNEGLTSPAYSQYVMMTKANVNYYYYYYLMLDFTKELLHMAKNLRHSFSDEQFGALLTIVPPLEEQKQIADFLDKKCAEIDKLIELQESMIEKLKEYKQSVITQAVTKGLDPDVPMKESGIEWIGKIPVGWNTVQLKNMATVYNGKEIENEIDNDSNAIEVYGSGGVFKYTDKFLYNGTAVLFGRKGSIGKPILVNNKRFWTVDTMYYSVPKVITYASYLYYVLIVFQWDLFATKTALPSIVATQVFNSIVMLPSLEEQQQIADYLDKKCAEIDDLIKLKEQKIEKLKEYKKSLIYEYVTGKKEVV